MKHIFKKWWREDNAIAAVEAGLMFPILISILMGVIDVGMGLTVNQKVVNGSHMVADLLAREDDITDSELNDAVVAGQLAMSPFDLAVWGYDIAGIRFEGGDETPTIIWRTTVNMTANASIEADSDGLGFEDEGVIVVTLSYLFSPFFTNFVVGDIQMEEAVFARGRNGLFVSRS